MNYKTTLLAGAAVLFAGQAMAADLTGALYTPNKGQLTSDTTLSYAREKAKHHWGAWDQVTLGETLEYGITDAFAINAGIANEFDTEGGYNNDHNFDYSLGAKYTKDLCNKLTFQVDAEYYTWNPKDFYGHHTPMRWQKWIGTDFKLGYAINDVLSVYGIYGFDTQIDVDHREFDQHLVAGVHAYTGKWALDGAFRYEFNTQGKNTNEWWTDLEADYYVAENVALGVYGSYFLGGTGADDIRYDYETGLRVKVAF